MEKIARFGSHMDMRKYTDWKADDSPVGLSEATKNSLLVHSTLSGSPYAEAPATATANGSLFECPITQSSSTDTPASAAIATEDTTDCITGTEPVPSCSTARKRMVLMPHKKLKRSVAESK
jgi:hypothetical protein